MSRRQIRMQVYLALVLVSFVLPIAVLFAIYFVSPQILAWSYRSDWIQLYYYIEIYLRLCCVVYAAGLLLRKPMIILLQPVIYALMGGILTLGMPLSQHSEGIGAMIVGQFLIGWGRALFIYAIVTVPTSLILHFTGLLQSGLSGHWKTDGRRSQY